MKAIIKKTVTLVLLASVLISSFGFFVGCGSGYQKHENIAYGQKTEEVMDVYIPNDASKRDINGCILFIHGGSWSGGDKSEEWGRCKRFAKKGYVTASMNYSLFSNEAMGEYSVNVVLQQIENALFKLKQFCSEKGVKIQRCATSGYSAGAHLSMLYAYSRASECPLQLVFTANMAGPAKLDSQTWGETSYKIVRILSGQEVTQAMIDSGESDALAKQYSPLTYVNEKTVPSIFAYGAKDKTVGIENGNALKQRFEELNLKHEYILFPQSGHGLAANPFKRIAYFNAVEKYCKKYFGY